AKKQSQNRDEWTDQHCSALYPSFYRLLYDHIDSVTYNGWIFQAFLAVVINFVRRAEKIDAALWLPTRQNGLMKAKGLAGSAKRISEGSGQRIQSYDGRMRVFELVIIIVVALIALTILIVCLFSTWMAFEKSLGLTF